jgi:Xaa-Pro aminopeptidase
MGSSEFKLKHDRLKQFLKLHSLKGVLLSTRANFSWLTCGRTNHVRSDSEKGVASLWVTPKAVELWCNSIEEARFQNEETKGLPLQYRVYPWYQTDWKPEMPPGRVASDDGAYGLTVMKEAIDELRWTLTAEEIKRYRLIGRFSGEAMEKVSWRIRKGWREQQVTAELSRELILRGLEANVILVGSDDRLRNFRHPIPTSRKIQKTVMMVICAKGYGLIANLTRIIHFGKISSDLRKRHEACLKVECAMWNATLPGREALGIFQAGVDEYARQGYPGEWKKHHQGGPTGYDTRDYLGTPSVNHKIVENQAMAWNPSITGTKSEDTILVTRRGLELLTPTPHWPMVKIKYSGKDFLRPDIWVKRI